MLLNNEPQVTTLELPWKDNQRRVSCIPDGDYTCKAVKGRKTSGGLYIPFTYEVLGVPGRDGILLHVGNTITDSEGCILIGEKFGTLTNKPAILESRGGFQKLLGLLLNVGEFPLTIQWITA